LYYHFAVRIVGAAAAKSHRWFRLRLLRLLLRDVVQGGGLALSTGFLPPLDVVVPVREREKRGAR